MSLLVIQVHHLRDCSWKGLGLALGFNESFHSIDHQTLRCSLVRSIAVVVRLRLKPKIPRNGVFIYLLSFFDLQEVRSRSENGTLSINHRLLVNLIQDELGSLWRSHNIPDRISVDGSFLVSVLWRADLVVVKDSFVRGWVRVLHCFIVIFSHMLMAFFGVASHW